MKAKIETNKYFFEIDFSKGKDISIPMLFNGEQPSTYNVPKAVSKPYKDMQFIGDKLVAHVTLDLYYNASL